MAAVSMDIAELRFLVVEDHGFQRWVLDHMLANLGARHVVTAADGREALDVVRASQPIDIILSDLDMPEMDGMEFIRHVGEAGCTASVILTSALDRVLVDSVGTMARAYGVRFLGTIEKPITAEKLAAVVELHRETSGAQHEPPAEFTVEEVCAAIEGGQVELLLQPKVGIPEGRLQGAEAFARWRHPSKGTIPASSFVPLLEEGGKGEALTWLMLEKAATACRTLELAIGEQPVGVNLPPAMLADVHLAERVLEAVRSRRAEPRCMILEVAESALASEPGVALENLARLRMKGFGLSIDAYGTGYSSLQQLGRIPFTELKIDQRFVRHAAIRPDHRAMLESSLEVARKLGLSAVAEGVENRLEWNLLSALGCPAAQGYYVAKPMPLESLLRWSRGTFA